MLEEEDVRKIVQAVRAVFHAEQSVTGEIADRWTGGQLVLQAGQGRHAGEDASPSRASSAS